MLTRSDVLRVGTDYYIKDWRNSQLAVLLYRRKIMTFTHAHEVQNSEELYKVANRYEYVMRMDEATDKLEEISGDIGAVMDVVSILEDFVCSEKLDDRIISMLELMNNRLEQMPKVLDSVVSQYLQGTQKGTKKFEEEESKFHQNNEG